MRATPLLMASALALVAMAGCLSEPSKAPADSDGDGFADIDEKTLGTDPLDPRSRPDVVDRNHDGVVVIAVIDSGFNPYHWDFLAAHMPQHKDADPGNDVPLDQDPQTWLLGHPGEDAFASYGPLPLNLTPEDGRVSPSELYLADAAWSTVEQSTSSEVHMQWIPGTKIVGYVNFGSGTGFAASSHGVGTSSVSVGNYHGSCPSCLMVFVNGLSEAAVDWAASQEWIDLQTNSWGASTLVWDKVYTACDNEFHRQAVERGHQIFFSGSNGQANAFVAPTFTTHSCQKGPDWLVTVGAISPTSDGSYTGHGKPVDVSSLGSQYPSAGGASVTANSTFSGTSNAAPVTAGMYSEALGRVRMLLDSPRMQDAGVLARGPAGCGEADPACPLADGELTVHEMRAALYEAATDPTGDWTVGVVNAELQATTDEMRMFSAGHGVYRAHFDGSWAEEVERLVAVVTGELDFPEPPEETAFFTAISYCSQEVWGHWEHGLWNSATPLPAPAPDRPLRSWLTEGCPEFFTAIKMAAGG